MASPIVTPLVVPAEVHTDDLVFQIDFDAEPFLRNADDANLRALRAYGWGCDETADRLAIEREPYLEEIARMFKYLDAIQQQPSKKDESGFEVIIDVEAAEQWVRAHRPDVLPCDA